MVNQHHTWDTSRSPTASSWQSSQHQQTNVSQEREAQVAAQTASTQGSNYNPGDGERGQNPYVATPGTEYGNEFFGFSQGQQDKFTAAAKKDKDAKIALAEELRHKQEERERTGTPYVPRMNKQGNYRGSGDLMAAEFFGMDDPKALHAWTTYDEKGDPIGHTGTLDEMAIARGWTSKDGKLTGKVPGFGQMTDINKYKYGLFDYGEFGYGPGPQWDKELIEFFGNKPEEGFSHAQLTEYLYSLIGVEGADSLGITDEMFLGGKPGQIGYGPGEKPWSYGKPRTKATGSGGGGGGGYGYGYGYGGGGGRGGGGYGYGDDEDPMARGYQRGKVGPGGLLEAVNQLYLRLSGMNKKRGGIVSLLELT